MVDKWSGPEPQTFHESLSRLSSALRASCPISSKLTSKPSLHCPWVSGEFNLPLKNGVVEAGPIAEGRAVEAGILTEGRAAESGIGTEGRTGEVGGQYTEASASRHSAPRHLHFEKLAL